MRNALLLSLLLLASSAVAHEQGTCKECDAAERARERTSVGGGGPDSSLVCFRVLMTDPHDSVSVTITKAGQKDKPLLFPREAAIKFAGQASVDSGKERPMICIKKSSAEGSSEILVIPGSKEGCGILRETHIAELIRRKSIPSDDPVCLLKSVECEAFFAEKK